jgi:hypothetical protein
VTEGRDGLTSQGQEARRGIGVVAEHAFGQPVSFADSLALEKGQADGWNSNDVLPRMVDETLTRTATIVRPT